MHLNTNQRCTGYTYQMLPPLKIPHKIKCIKKIQVTYQFSYLQQLNTTQRCTCCTKRKLLPLCNQERTLEVKLESFWSDTPNITFSAIKRTLARTVKRILAPCSHKDKAERTFFLQTFFCKKPVHQTNMLTSVRHAWNTGICSSNTKNARRRAGYSCQIEGINHKTKKDRFWGKEPEPLEYVPAEHSKHIDEDDFPDDKEIKIIGSCIATLKIASSLFICKLNNLSFFVLFDFEYQDLAHWNMCLPDRKCTL